MNNILWFFGFVIAVAIIPPKYDPAIRLKEWAERKRNGDH